MSLKFTTRQLACENFSCMTQLGRDGNGLLISIFPKHHYLFRAAPEETAFSERELWFSTVKGIKKYVDKDSPCRRYVAKRDLLLLSTYDMETIDRLIPLLNERDAMIVRVVTGRNITTVDERHRSNLQDVTRHDPSRSLEWGSEMRFSPHGYITVGDSEYINFKFAKIVCKLGYDGWYIKDKSIIDLAMGAYATEEIMLCNARGVLALTDDGCGYGLWARKPEDRFDFVHEF